VILFHLLFSIEEIEISLFSVLMNLKFFKVLKFIPTRKKKLGGCSDHI